MSKSLKIVITIAVIILLGLGAWWLFAQPAENSSTETFDTTSDSQTSTPTPDGIMIVYNDNGFEQQTYSVVAGQSVTVKNESSVELQFSSDVHPTHTDNTELNMVTLQPDKQTLFTPDTSGEWGVHDHKHPEFTSTLIVSS